MCFTRVLSRYVIYLHPHSKSLIRVFNWNIEHSIQTCATDWKSSSYFAGSTGATKALTLFAKSELLTITHRSTLIERDWMRVLLTKLMRVAESTVQDKTASMCWRILVYTPFKYIHRRERKDNDQTVNSKQGANFDFLFASLKV